MAEIHNFILIVIILLMTLCALNWAEPIERTMTIHIQMIEKWSCVIHARTYENKQILMCVLNELIHCEVQSIWLFGRREEEGERKEERERERKARWQQSRSNAVSEIDANGSPTFSSPLWMSYMTANVFKAHVHYSHYLRNKNGQASEVERDQMGLSTNHRKYLHLFISSSRCVKCLNRVFNVLLCIVEWARTRT